MKVSKPINPTKKNQSNTHTKNQKQKDIKLKGLRPTLRVKKRFLLLQTHFKDSSLEQTIELSEIIFAINAHLLKILGTMQYAQFGIWVVREKCDETTKQIVLKTTPKGVEYVRAALALGLKIKSHECRVEIVNISGTLKGVFNTS